MAGNPSSWVNLQDYLGLNADQGEQMANDVYQHVNDQATKAGQQLTTDVQGYNTAVGKGSVQAPNVDYSQVDPNQAAANAAKQYTGPTDLASYDPTLEMNVSGAIQQMQQAADPNQRGYVLQETYGSKAGQTVGDNAFDSFLTGASPGAAQLDTFGQKYKDLQSALGLSEQNAYDTAQGAMKSSQENAQTWGNDAAWQQSMKQIGDIKNANMKGYNAYAMQLPDNGADMAKFLQGQRPSGAAWSKMTDEGIKNYTKRWQPELDNASSQLGVSKEKLLGDIAKMSGTEARDFLVLGVVPPWMSDVDASKRGRIGGWNASSMGAVLKYGSDGGMWNAVTNTWKNGVLTLGKAAAGGPGGIIGTAGQTAVSGAGSNPGKGISY